MRLIIVLGAICALTGAASAQTADCSSIADPAAKLACYNNEPPPTHARPATARPPAVARAPVAARPAASTSGSSKYVDQIGEEDAIVSAKMRGICRGC
jgi:hypothetical protein